jgi:TonB family protein
MREAQAQARIDHPNVVTIHEAGEHEGTPFLSMPFIHGPSLAKAAGQMDLRERVDAVRQAALGVHAAHQLGIVHRDLKPANIMVEPLEPEGWRAVVMDFGMARDLRDTPAGNTAVMGTPAYMSPEQIQGPSVLIGPHSDVYALGVTLFEILTGHPPFPGSNHAEVFRKVVEAEAPPLRSMDPDLPGELEAIVQRCLEKDVLRRYDTALALADDLGRFLEGRPVLARPVGPLQRAVRRIRRNPLPAAAAAVVILLAGGWLSYALASRARVRALGLRMEAQQADLARLQGQLEGLRRRQEEEQSRSDELARRMMKAASQQERQEAEAQLRESQERERDLARQVEEARRRLEAEAKAPARPEPLPPQPPSPEPKRPEAVRPDPPPAVAEGEAPVTAPQVLQQALAIYPARARAMPNFNLGREASVLVRVSVDAQGRCLSVTVLAGIPGSYGFDEAAVEAMRRSTYAPALRGGKPVPGTLDVRVRFPRR